MAAVVALQKYALGGKRPGPFFRNLPIVRPVQFMLLAWTTTTFKIEAVQMITFQLLAQRQNPFQLGV